MEEEEAAPPSYYYSDAARGALGPCLLSQLRVLWVSGHISRDTSVWREGLGSWLPIHALPEVSNELLPLAHPSSHQVGSAQGPAEWYFLDADGQRSGAAHTVEQMGRLLASGELDGMSLVWREGMAEWLELGQVAVLRAAGQAATEPEDEPPPEQQVFDPYADLGPAQQARAGLNQRKKGGAAAAAVAAGAPAAAGSAAEDAATGGAGAEGDAKPKRVRKKKPKFKAAQHVEGAVFTVPQLAARPPRAHSPGVRGRLAAARHSGRASARLLGERPTDPREAVPCEAVRRGGGARRPSRIPRRCTPYLCTSYPGGS